MSTFSHCSQSWSQNIQKHDDDRNPLCEKKHFNTSFQFVPSANMEREGLRGDTAASHQGENQVLFSGAVLLLI